VSAVSRSVERHCCCGMADLARLAAVPDLYAAPVRLRGDPPVYNDALRARAAPFWRTCASAPHGGIPNAIHQPWLHGTTPKWEHILGMIAAKFIVRPDKYILYYDRLPPRSQTWMCACALATCKHRRPSTHVSGRRIRMGHWPEIMRYDVLLDHGGIFLDHDSYALTPLDDLRRCCATTATTATTAPPPAAVVAASTAEKRAPTGGASSCAPAAVVAGFEQEDGARKLNPGTLMAEPHAEFLRLCRAAAAHTLLPNATSCRPTAQSLCTRQRRLLPSRPRLTLCTMSRTRWRASWANYSSRDWDYKCAPEPLSRTHTPEHGGTLLLCYVSAEAARAYVA
jgi:hypothetical protein